MAFLKPLLLVNDEKYEKMLSLPFFVPQQAANI